MTRRSRQPGSAGLDTAEPPDLALPPEVRRTVLVVLAGVLMSFLDTTIVNVALESVSVGLGTSVTDGQWAVTAYLLAFAAVIPSAAWAGQRLGTKRLYILSLLLFTAGSALCGAAQSSWQLTAARAFQGVGAGLMGPTSQTILVLAAGPARLARVMAAFNVPVMLAPLLGPMLGGVILEYAGWRWIFLCNVPIGLLAWALAARGLPRLGARPGECPARAAPLDVTGFTLAALGMSSLTFGLTAAGASHDLNSVPTLTGVSVGVLSIAVFAWRSLRVPHPLLDLTLFRNAVFRSASWLTLAMGVVIFGGMILLPLYFQVVRHDGVVETGLLVAPQGLGLALTMWLSGMRFADRLGSLIALIGVLIALLATVPFAFISVTMPVWVLAVTMVFRGAGMGLASMPVMTAAFRAVRADRTAEVSTQLGMLQRLGGAIGTAMFVVVLYWGLSGAVGTAAQDTAFRSAFCAVVLVNALAVVPAVLIIRASRGRDPDGPP